MAETPNTQGTPEPTGYTQEKLLDDTAATLRGQTKSNVLDQINAGLTQSRKEIERLTDEMSLVTLNPGLIPVPEDAQINPLIAIGATLRGMGGDSSALDALVQSKQRVADYQRQVEAQNVVIQNEHQRRQYDNIFAQLEAERDKVERFEFEAAEIVDKVAKTEEERRFASFETRVDALGDGVGDVDSIINDFPQEFEASAYSRQFLTAMKRRGDLAYDRAKRLAKPEPNNTRDPQMPGWASQDAQDATKVLSRGYWISKDDRTGKTIQVPLTADEILSEYTTLKAAISSMPEEQAKIWQARLDDYTVRYKDQLGIPDKDNVLGGLEAFEQMILGGGDL